MREKPSTEEVIIVFTEHPVLGPLLTPYLAERDENGTYHLMEQAFHASPERFAKMSERNDRPLRSPLIMRRNI
ncbi:Snf2 family helicase [Bacteroides reticulotermitis JCM 10512]|uniref:Snf2 family helicase n=1 Tax=Bacteroides reticulotermitis JCM 10512 TaxID=1445607 RepID=W4UNS0_9BACE|nr:Snf2 family helicase [Bacteroides reticulotermitis JCM 10512]